MAEAAARRADAIRNVLFLCTGNSARSILAEAVMRRLGKGRFHAYSAGSRPAGRVNSFALEVLKAHGHGIESLRSKSWDEFAGPDAPEMDLVVTVCDGAAGETCPLWPGHPATLHWSIADPAAARGTSDQQRRAFEDAYGAVTELVSEVLRR